MEIRRAALMFSLIAEAGARFCAVTGRGKENFEMPSADRLLAEVSSFPWTLMVNMFVNHDSGLH
jgi:hypothetical protein